MLDGTPSLSLRVCKRPGWLGVTDPDCRGLVAADDRLADTLVVQGPADRIVSEHARSVLAASGSMGMDAASDACAPMHAFTARS
jgi:hypothetical protein